MSNQEEMDRIEIKMKEFDIIQETIRMYVRIGIVITFFTIFISVIYRYLGTEEGLIKPIVLYSFLTGILVTKIIEFYMQLPEKEQEEILRLSPFQRKKEYIRIGVRIFILVGFFGIFVYVILSYVGLPKEVLSLLSLLKDINSIKPTTEDIKTLQSIAKDLAAFQGFYINPNAVYSFLTGVMVTKLIDYFLQPLKGKGKSVDEKYDNEQKQ